MNDLELGGIIVGAWWSLVAVAWLLKAYEAVQRRRGIDSKAHSAGGIRR